MNPRLSLAEREGVEPSSRFLDYTLSKRAQPNGSPLGLDHKLCICIKNLILAVGKGFEPLRTFRPYTLSKRAP